MQSNNTNSNIQIPRSEKLNQRNYHSWAENTHSFALLNGLSNNLKYDTFLKCHTATHQPSDREIAFNQRLEIIKLTHADNADALDDHIDRLEIRYNTDLASWSTNKSNARKRWDENELKLFGLFQSTIEETIWSAVKHLPSAEEIWKQLKVETLQNETGYLAALVKAFARATINPNESYCSYLARINSIVEKLKAIGRQPPENWIIMQVLAQLPDECHKTTDPLFRLKPNELTMERLKSEFLAADSNRLNKDSSNQTPIERSNAIVRKCMGCSETLPPNIPANYKRCSTCQNNWNKERSNLPPKDNAKPSTKVYNLTTKPDADLTTKKKVLFL